MNHKQYIQAVKEYRQKSGHSINYYDGGAENSPVNHPGTPYARKREQKGSLARDKMQDLNARADGSVNRGSRRKNILGELNDQK